MKSACMTMGLILAFGCASPVGAVVIDISFSGTLYEGTDNAGYLGLPGRDLAGLPYRSIFTLTFPSPGATIQNQLNAVSITGTGLAFLTGRIVIDGVSFDGPSGASTRAFIGYGNDAIGCDHCLETFDSVQYNLFDQVGFATLVSNHTTAFGLFDGQPSLFKTFDYDPTNDLQTGNRTDFRYGGTYPNFGITAVGYASRITATLSKARPVPEPASWAMMVVGFGLVGGALRNRRTDVRFGKALPGL